MVVCGEVSQEIVSMHQAGCFFKPSPAVIGQRHFPVKGHGIGPSHSLPIETHPVAFGMSHLRGFLIKAVLRCQSWILLFESWDPKCSPMEERN